MVGGWCCSQGGQVRHRLATHNSSEPMGGGGDHEAAKAWYGLCRQARPLLATSVVPCIMAQAMEYI